MKVVGERRTDPIDELPAAAPSEGVDRAGEKVLEVDMIDNELVDWGHVLLREGRVKLLTATRVAKGGSGGDEGEGGRVKGALTLTALTGHDLIMVREKSEEEAARRIKIG